MKATGIRKSSYRAKYEDISNQFWKLQQTEETEEEAEYARLCMELEKMLSEYRTELEDLESENIRLQKQLEDTSEMRKRYQEVRDEEEYLLSLKRDLDAVRQ